MRYWVILILFLTNLCLVVAQQKVEGYVGDYTNGSGISGVEVRIDSISQAKTNEDGFFEFTISPGIYNLQFKKAGYIEKTEKVQVKPGVFVETTLQVDTKYKAPIESIVQEPLVVSDSTPLAANPSVTDSTIIDTVATQIVQDVPVDGKSTQLIVKSRKNQESEAAAIDDQKKASEQKQNVAAEELSRKGAGDVEAGLTKVSGVSKVGSRGVFVRGLEDRYNNLLVNGLSVPSDNPFNKIINLSTFPTDIVGNIEIFKTFHVPLYADFGGATFNIETKKPIKKETKISFGLGLNTISNFKTFLVQKTGNGMEDYFGLTLKDRKVPSFLGSVPSNQILTPDQVLSIKYNYDVEKVDNNFNRTLGFSHSNDFKLGRDKFSYLITANFDNDYKYKKGIQNSFQNTGVFNNSVNFESYSYNTQFSGLAALALTGKKYTLNLNNITLQSSTSEIYTQIGFFNNFRANPNEFRRTLEYKTNFLNATQLFFNTNFGVEKKYELGAGIAYNIVKYNLPDRRQLRGNVSGEEQITTTYQGNSQLRQYLAVDGVKPTGDIHFSLGLIKDENDKWRDKITIGANGYFDDYTNKFRFISINPNSNGAPVIVNYNQPDSVFDLAVTDGNLILQETSTSQYKTTLQQLVGAAYANYQYRPNSSWDINIGVRGEYSNKEIGYDETGSFGGALTKKTFDSFNLLGSISAKKEISRKTNIRLALSNTITRPALMENIPIFIINADATAFVGNENLKDSKNYNFDFKWEYFPGKAQLIALDFYAKYIDKPIESTIVATASSEGQNFSFTNSDNAILVGLEFDWLWQIPFVKNLYLGTSAALQYSKVEVGSSNTFLTNQDRPLQGASPWLLNTDLKYTAKMGRQVETTATLAYSVYGRRIYYVGAAGLDDVYENPFHQLDFIWDTSLGENWSLKFSAKNILNLYYQREIGEDGVQIQENTSITDRYKRGVNFSLGATYKF